MRKKKVVGPGKLRSLDGQQNIRIQWIFFFGCALDKDISLRFMHHYSNFFFFFFFVFFFFFWILVGILVLELNDCKS